MARPNWEYIRVDVLAPEHPKIEGLSDKAFRALFTLWCHCGKLRTDGLVSAKQWKAWPPKVRAELVSAGLVDTDDLTVAMHDWTGEPDGHQRSRREIEEVSAARSEAGRKAAAARWNGHTKTHALRIPNRMRAACATHMRSPCLGSCSCSCSGRGKPWRRYRTGANKRSCVR